MKPLDQMKSAIIFNYEAVFHKVKYGAERIWVEVERAYLAGAANDAGLIVVDVANPAAPKVLGGYHRPTCSESITDSGSLAYLGHGDWGLEIIDISRPAMSPVVDHQDAAGKARGVHVVGSLAYIANGYTGLRILNVSDHSALREVGHLSTFRSMSVRVVGRYAYIADDFQGMTIIDISSLAAPRKVVRLDTPGEAMGDPGRRRPCLRRRRTVGVTRDRCVAAKQTSGRRRLQHAGQRL